LSTIACIGGTTLDRRARAHEPLIKGTSNPATVATRPGGVARNVADWLSQLGVDVALYSAMGDDRVAYDLLRQLATRGVDVSGVRRSAVHPTATYTAALEPDGELALGLADMEIFEELDADWCDAIAPEIEKCPLWLVDANLPRATLDYLLNTYGDQAIIVADPVSVAKAERLRPFLDAVDVVVPDRKEAAVLSGHLTETPEQVAAAAAQIWELGPGTVIVTLGAEGIYLEDGTCHQTIPATAAKDVSDVTGAGDGLVAGYLFGLVTDHTDPIACGLAAASLALEVNAGLSEGTTREALMERVRSEE
jgi:pseudouridine kinase